MYSFCNSPQKADTNYIKVHHGTKYGHKTQTVYDQQAGILCFSDSRNLFFDTKRYFAGIHVYGPGPGI